MRPEMPFPGPRELLGVRSGPGLAPSVSPVSPPGKRLTTGSLSFQGHCPAITPEAACLLPAPQPSVPGSPPALCTVQGSSALPRQPDVCATPELPRSLGCPQPWLTETDSPRRGWPGMILPILQR